MALNRPNGDKINQDFPLQDPPKFTQIGIFDLKTNHVATLPSIHAKNSFQDQIEFPNFQNGQDVIFSFIIKTFVHLCTSNTHVVVHICMNCTVAVKTF
jgi:hypothetical protein